MSDEKICHFCSNSPEDEFETLFNAWCSESVQPSEMGLDFGKKAMRKTHLKHKFEVEAEKNAKLIDEAKKSKEEAIALYDKLDKDLKDNSWNFVKKKNAVFGDNLCAVPALKYVNDDDMKKFGSWTVTTYKDVSSSGVVPENIDKIMKIMAELGYNNNLKSFYEDLKYTMVRVKNYKLIKVPEELALNDYMVEEFKKANPYPYTDIKVFGETVSICPICKEIFKNLQ